MNILVDAMGGDHAPAEIVKGSVAAVRQHGVAVTLVGDKAKIRSELGGEVPGVAIVPTTQVITNYDDPAKAIRTKKDSSLVVGMRLLAEDKGDAFVSAGSTGALISGATLIVRRIQGVRRVAMATALPSKGKPTLLLDSGANADCTPEFLQQFAIMGSAYAKGVWGIERPTVGLLNIGAEEGKGNELAKASYDALKQLPIAFSGNVEAREVLSGAVDVLVTDGFSGNVLLKSTEGTAKYVAGLLKEMLTSSLSAKLCALALSKKLEAFKKNFDYKEYGGAPVLGTRGVVFKAHGSSDATAICNAIREAKKFAENKVISTIEKNI